MDPNNKEEEWHFFREKSVYSISYKKKKGQKKRTLCESIQIREPNEIKYYSDDFIRAQLETGTGVLGPAWVWSSFYITTFI